MTDETTPAAPVERPTIAAAVAERLSGVAPITREKVVDHFAQKLASKQAEALIKGLDKLDELNRELAKAKPDQVSLDEAGEVVSATFSKDKFEARKKLIEQIEKLTKAINKADEKGDFGDLYNLTK